MSWLQKLLPGSPVHASAKSVQTRTPTAVLPGGFSPATSNISQSLFETHNLKSFFYIDEDQVLQLYQQLVPLQLTGVEAQSIKKVRRILGFSFGKGPEAKAEGETDDALVQRYIAATSPASMYQTVEPHLLHISTVLDHNEAPDETLAIFDNFCQLAQERTSFSIPPEVRDSIYTAIHRDAALRLRDQIAKLEGFVAFSGDFLVTTGLDEIYLDYQHPMNRWLDYDDYRIQIRVTFNSEHGLSASGKTHFRDGTPARVTCVGKVAGWDMGPGLLVCPIAIY
jgi:hypothetical protein